MNTVQQLKTKGSDNRMRSTSKFGKYVLLLSVGLAIVPRGHAQAAPQSGAQTEVAKVNDAAQPPGDTSSGAVATTSETPDQVTSVGDQKIPLAVLEELAAMKKRIAELEAEMGGTPADQPAAAAPAADPAAPTASATEPPAQGATAATPAPTPAPKDISAERLTKSAPFAYADFTWMNGNTRSEDAPLATKYFVPEFRADTHYMLDYNHPEDDTLGGSTESFRSDEFQLEQLSFGGDLRIDNVRGRVLTMFGLFSTTTPRNDGSVARGQWDLSDAYRYVSEAWGGYHFDVNHGLNVDGGIFVSYIGLFSYYNFDNWTYQPSFVSSNTPWFFNGLRIQWFPTDKLKIEPWIINGWQSYARSGSKPGLGGQILWRPRGWLSFVANNYGLGEDTFSVPSRRRIHTDNSVEVKFYDHPDRMLDKMALSFTLDAGCEYGVGSGVTCTGNGKDGPKQDFVGWMEYDRFWFHKDLFAITLGGGVLDNPGRYLTLLPPIDGASATTGSAYFSANPGDQYNAWDTTATFDYMPSEFLTFRAEIGYRHADQPYWSGRGGITPPGGNNGFPGQYACANGAASGITPTGSTDGNVFSGDVKAVETACLGIMGLSSETPLTSKLYWTPDLRQNQLVSTLAIMVKF